jgi:hypothetical protein
MNSRPLILAPEQRALLREFERLHEQWREVSAAADAIECCCGVERHDVQRLLEFRLAADRVHQQAMRLLRETPI